MGMMLAVYGMIVEQGMSRGKEEIKSHAADKQAPGQDFDWGSEFR